MIHHILDVVQELDSYLNITVPHQDPIYDGVLTSTGIVTTKQIDKHYL